MLIEDRNVALFDGSQEFLDKTCPTCQSRGNRAMPSTETGPRGHCDLPKLHANFILEPVCTGTDVVRVRSR